MSFPQELLDAAKVAVGSCHLRDDIRNARVGCIIKRRDGVTVKARNAATKVPMPGCHAEFRASRKSDFGAIAYVARIRRDGSFGMARPCPSCSRIMKSRGIKEAYYTISDNEWGCLELNK